MAAKNELQKLLMADESHGKHLENDELTTVRRNLQTQGVDVPYEIVSASPLVGTDPARAAPTFHVSWLWVLMIVLTNFILMYFIILF